RSYDEWALWARSPRDAAGRSLSLVLPVHEARRLPGRPGADPREPRPILYERSGAADDAAHDERQKKRQRSNGSAALRTRWQEPRRRLRELRAKSSLQLAEESARRPEGAYRDRRHRCNLSVATRYRG